MLDDFSRYIIAWKLFTTTTATDVKEVLDQAQACRNRTARDKVTICVRVRHRPLEQSASISLGLYLGLVLGWVQASSRILRIECSILDSGLGMFGTIGLNASG